MQRSEGVTRTTDGRSTRWAEHRAARRVELVEATIRALRRHGAGVGMDEVAAMAGTSKTVLYRHFTDKGQLYLAVCQHVTERLVAIAGGRSPREMLAAGIDGYLQLIEGDPEVYRFVVRQPLARPVGTDPVAGLTALVGEHVTAILAERLRATGRDPSLAPPWGHGIVGMVRAAADVWLEQPARTSRAELTARLTDLAWSGLSGVLADQPGSRPHQRPAEDS